MDERPKRQWHYPRPRPSVPKSFEETVTETLTKILTELELIRKILKENKS